MYDDESPSVAYIRVSTEKQEERGHSLREQRRSTLQHIEANPRLELADNCGDGGVYVETGSGTGTERPVYQQMMDDFREGRWEVVVSSKLDRLHRSVKNATIWAEELKESGGHFILLDMNIDTTTIGGELVFNIMAAVAQMEAKLTQERTRIGLLSLTRKGKWKGHPPYGYAAKHSITGDPHDTGILEVIPEESEVIKQIYNMWHQGLTHYAIVGQLMHLGIRPRGRRATKTGQKNLLWHPSTISAILNRKRFYKGWLAIEDEEEVKGLHEPILGDSEEE